MPMAALKRPLAARATAFTRFIAAVFIPAVLPSAAAESSPNCEKKMRFRRAHPKVVDYQSFAGVFSAPEGVMRRTIVTVTVLAAAVLAARAGILAQTGGASAAPRPQPAPA